MLEIRLELAKDAPWAKAGHVVARNQFVLGNERCELAQGGTQPAPARGNAKKKPEVRRSGDGSITITCGESAADSATGVTEKTTLEFSPTGTLRSISKGGRKIGFASCRPDFWRAITDNDRGNGFMERLGVWKLASWWTILMPASCDVAETDEGATVTVHYPLPPQVAAETSLVWKISGDGRITLAQKLSAAKGRNIPEIPFIGIEAVLETEAGEVEWYGAGPTDNYIDRLEGAPIREYRMRLAESYVPYLKPQECGNRTGVRRLSVKTGTASLRFGNCTASERPVYGTSGVFEFSALPWGREEIEKARHTYELDKPVRTVLRLSASQMGVGGDDSWGAQTLPEYILSAERDYDWSIDIAID
jgi:beta-galactosidase